MMHWSLATVEKELAARPGVQELEVMMPEGLIAKAIHYTDSLPVACPGDRVWLNTTAVLLNLGTGGYHFVLAFADKEQPVYQDEQGLSPSQGHMMKLRYTPLQRAVLSAEEQSSPHHELFKDRSKRLDGMPVLIGELHSMLPIATAWLRYRSRHPMKIVYIMSDGGALPLAFSNQAAYLRGEGWIDGTVTYGHAYGGEVETMNKFTALLAAKHILGADIVIVTMGPGMAGTGTELGHTGIETGEIANAVVKLGGMPVLMPRVSFADQRSRHRGISHHTLAVLEHVVAYPTDIVLPRAMDQEKRAYMAAQLNKAVPACPIRWVDEVNIVLLNEALNSVGISIRTMGRGVEEDPYFFLSVAAAAEQAIQLHRDHLD
jgi:hypothetical protein